MKKGDKEFYELQAQFERDVSNITYGHRYDRETGKNLPRGIFYQDGAINQLFQAYMMGYEYAKSLAR